MEWPTGTLWVDNVRCGAYNENKPCVAHDCAATCRRKGCEAAGEEALGQGEKRETNGNRKRGYYMLALAIIPPVVLFVVVPAFLLVVGLCRSAAQEPPTPGDTGPIRTPSSGPRIVGQPYAWRKRRIMRRQLAKANYN